MAKMTMTEIDNTIKSVNNISYTENGAVGFKTTFNPLVDLNFRTPSLRKSVTPEDAALFALAMDMDVNYAIKWLFYLRDVRGGLGERNSFVALYNELNKVNPELALKCVSLIPEFGRWKDVVDVAFNGCKNSSLESACFALIEDQLREDIANFGNKKSVSLLAKWLPSINASQKAREKAKVLCTALNLNFKEYRKMLAGLRKYLDVTEVKTCGGDWNTIDYNKVSSNANLRYKDAFMKHDAERRTNYLKELANPTVAGAAVMHAKDLTTSEIWNKYCTGSWSRSVRNYDEALEQMWKNLKQIDCTGDTMCVVDGSGSMCTTIGTGNIMAIDVARSLGTYFSEHNNGAFKDKFITFSSRPQIVDLSSCKTLQEKINVCGKYNDCSNTDIEKVFRLILQTAIDNKMTQEDIPSRVLIVSDMEFDCATTFGWRDDVVLRTKTLFESIGDEFAKHGYTLPKLVFWNVNSRTNTIPVTQNKAGVILVSGYSTNILNMVMSGQADPWFALKEILDGDRYKVIDKCLA